MFRWIETIGVFWGEVSLLSYHQKRVDATFAKFLPHTPPFSIAKILDTLEIPCKDIWKIRILYSASVEDVRIEKYQPIQHTHFYLIENSQLNYSFKFADRTFFEQLKSGTQDREYIITQKGKITDCTYGNLIFWNGKNWITPRSYLLNGIQRQFLLQHDVIQEEEIFVSDIKKFSKFRIINALNPLNGSFEYPIEAIQFQSIFAK